jgi:hypothetical protein
VPLLVFVGLVCFCKGLGLFQKGCQTLYFWAACQVFDKRPQRTSSMPRGRGSSSRSSGSHAIVARSSIEGRKLLLKNTFAIKEEFSNNEATSWAVEELKRRGLKRLFKPVASTAYERLVREFYKHLRIDCDQPKILFSYIDGREVEVTIADVAAVLKCSHEPLESDIPWLECPSMLTLETSFQTCVRGNMQTIVGMQPARRRFLGIFYSSIWCFIGTCVLWDTRHRGETYSSVPSTHSKKASGAPFLRSSGVRSRKFCEGVHHRGAEHTKTCGLPFPFLITHILRKKGIKGTSADGPITESPYFGPHPVASEFVPHAQRCTSTRARTRARVRS